MCTASILVQWIWENLPKEHHAFKIAPIDIIPSFLNRSCETTTRKLTYPYKTGKGLALGTKKKLESKDLRIRPFSHLGPLRIIGLQTNLQITRGASGIGRMLNQTSVSKHDSNLSIRKSEEDRSCSFSFYCCLSMCTASILVQWIWENLPKELHAFKIAPIDIIPIPTVFIPLQHLVYWRSACGEPLLVQLTHTEEHLPRRTERSCRLEDKYGVATALTFLYRRCDVNFRTNNDLASLCIRTAAHRRCRPARRGFCICPRTRGLHSKGQHNQSSKFSAAASNPHKPKTRCGAVLEQLQPCGSGGQRKQACTQEHIFPSLVQDAATESAAAQGASPQGTHSASILRITLPLEPRN